jgi:hypothetical protein
MVGPVIRRGEAMEPTAAGAAIPCPHCGRTFELTEALAAPLVERHRREVEARASEREAAVLERERALVAEKAAVDARAKTVTAEIEARLAEGRSALVARLEREAREKARAERDAEAEDARSRNEALGKKVAELTDRVVALLQEKRALEDAEQQRRLAAAEREREVEAATRTKVEEEGRLRLLDREQKIASLAAELERARRMAEQGSQQSQGETLEGDLESLLRREFPTDAVEPVAKGVRGADVVLRVRLASGRECGSILWETKRTKAWTESWIGKLKDDQADASAAFAVIVTTALPKDVTAVALRDGVFVTSPACALALAAMLRKCVVDLACARQAGEGLREKTAALYDYVASAEFRGRLEAISHAAGSLYDELQREQRVFQAAWKRRRRQIDRVVGNLAGLGGELQGILGGEALRLPGLELDALAGPDGEPDDDDA